MARRGLARAPLVVALSPRRRSPARRYIRAARRGFRRHRKSISAFSIAISGAVLGYLGGRGTLKQLPALAGSRNLSVAAAGWALNHFSRSPALRTVGLAAMAVGVFNWSALQAQGGGKAAGLEEVEGDDEAAAY